MILWFSECICGGVLRTTRRWRHRCAAISASVAEAGIFRGNLALLHWYLNSFAANEQTLAAKLRILRSWAQDIKSTINVICCRACVFFFCVHGIYFVCKKNMVIVFKCVESHNMLPKIWSIFFSVQQQNAFGNSNRRSSPFGPIMMTTSEIKGSSATSELNVWLSRHYCFKKNTHIWCSRERDHLDQYLENLCTKWVHIYEYIYI